MSLLEGNPTTVWLIEGVRFTILILVLLRFGLFTLVSAFFVATLSQLLISFDFWPWHHRGGLFFLGVIALLTAYGFFTSVAGRPLFRDTLFEK